MIARFVVIDGENMALVLARPNRTEAPQISLSYPAEITQHPNSKRESRRTYARSARYEIQYRVRLGSADEATEFRIWLNQQKDQTMAVPLWTDVCRFTSGLVAGATVLPIDQHPVRSGTFWIVMNADASIYEIVSAAAVSSSTLTLSAGLANNWPLGTAAAYPLVCGRLNERPELDARTPEKAECVLQLKESSSFPRRINQYPTSISTVGGQIPNLSTLPMWPLGATYERLLDKTEAQVVFDQVGFGRVESKLLYNQPNARVLERTFVCRSRDEMASVEYFFANRKGQVSSFAITTERNDLQLAADIVPGVGGTHNFTIAIGEYSDAGRTPHQGDPYIAFVETLQIAPTITRTVDPHKIDTVAGATITTNQLITVPHWKDRTRIEALMVVRLADPKLTWVMDGDGWWTCRLKFLELPNEYAAPSPALKESFFCYLFVEQSKYPRTWAFTSYEDTIVLPIGQAPFNGTYTPTLIGHKSLRRTLDLAAQKLEIVSGSFTGNPLSLFFPFQLEGPLMLYLLEGNVADLTELVKVRFFGQVTSPQPTLREGQVQLLGRLMERKLPMHIFSTVDNADIFSGVNGLNPADWKISGTIAAIAPATIDVTSAAAHTLVTNDATYFTHGKLEIGATGATYETRIITDCALITGGVRLTINRPLIKTVATGGAIDIYPGYDGSIEQRAARFGDAINHGGMPFVPDTSTTIKAANTQQQTAKK